MKYRIYMVTGANFYSCHSLQSVSGSIKLIFPSKLGNVDSVNKEYVDYKTISKTGTFVIKMSYLNNERQILKDNSFKRAGETS